MSEYEFRFKIHEKGYRNGVYGKITTTVYTDGRQPDRTEEFHSLEVRDEYEPTGVNTEKIAKEIKAKTKSEDQQLPEGSG